MARFGFVGPSYTSQSRNADDQDLFNWYVESIESGGGQSAAALYQCPGSKLFCALGGVTVRGVFTINGRAFGVSGANLYELNADGTKTLRGAVGDDNKMASMVASSIQLLIASAGNLYCMNLGTNAFTAVQGNLGFVTMVAYSDATFFALLQNSQEVQYSALNDATSWDPTNVFQVSVFPDNVVSMLVDHREVWLFGSKQTVPYADTGDLLNPWAPILGGFIEQGIAAQLSPVRLDNSIFWLGGDERGQGIVWRAQGYVPARISNHAVEYAWSQYSTISDAVGYSYQDQGHAFYVLYFPTANATWVYDTATGLWHRRGFWNSNRAQYEAHHSRCHIFCFGKHLVGDWATGNVYEINIDFKDDNGTPIRWMRRAPTISEERQWIFHDQLEVLMDVGQPDNLLIPTPATGPTSVILKDAHGIFWALEILPDGRLQTVGGQAGPATTLFLNDVVGQQTWKIGVATDGRLTTTAVPYQVTTEQVFPMTAVGSELQAALQVSNGLLQTQAPVPAYRQPQICLRWSDDGGNTWSNEHWVSCGWTGSYQTRVIWRRMGRSRARIYEVSCTDPIGWRIVDAYLQASPGYQPTGRLSDQLRKGA